MGHQCGCGGTHNEIISPFNYNLYAKIDKNRVQCLNEYEDGTGITVFKTWEERLNRNQSVVSDVDPELLFNIPFTGNVKLKGLIVIGDEDYIPKTVKLYKNRPNMTFDNAVSPDQEFDLHTDPRGLHEYPVKTVKFSSVHHLSLHFNGDIEEEHIRIYYIGLKGEWTAAYNSGVAICSYESRPLISDHPRSFPEIINRHVM